MACSFTAISRSILSGGSVRFFPVVTGNTRPITGYSWTFGDTGTSTDATPIHTYPTVSTLTSYNVSLAVTDASGATASHTENGFILSDSAANVPAIPTDGTYSKVSVFIYNATDEMMVNRNPTDICSLYLLRPKIQNLIDKSSTTTFSILDVGNSTSTEKTLMVQGSYVIFIQGKTIVFSGMIRRVTQNLQNGFDASMKMKLWDIECDSDLTKLSSINVQASSLSSDGSPIRDTPGNIARRILDPGSAWDWRGNICCNDTKITYNLNSAASEQVQSQYDHITTLRANTNYDLITRYDFDIYRYDFSDLASTITVTGAGWTTNQFAGSYVFLVSDIYYNDDTQKGVTFDIASQTIQVADQYYTDGMKVAFTPDTVLPTGVAEGIAYYTVNTTPTSFQVSLTLGGSPITFSGTDGLTATSFTVGQCNGCYAWGVVGSNTNDTITLSSSTWSSTFSLLEANGYFIIANGPKIDFAADLSTPSAVATFNVNKNVYQYSDNDDKRKFLSKVVASGKDLRGITISVALTACHAYDNTRQYYNDSTHVTLKSEGYIYKNNYALISRGATAVPLWASPNTSFTTNYSLGFNNTIYPVSSAANIHNNTEVYFSVSWGSTLPSNIVALTKYYVRDKGIHGADTFNISATIGGLALDIGSDASGSGVYFNSNGGLEIDNTDSYVSPGSQFYIFATSAMPSGTTTGPVYEVITVGTTNPSWISFKDPGTGTPIGVLSAGSGVYIVRVNDFKNVDLGTTPIVQLYGWGYSIPDGSNMAFSIPGGSTLGTVTTGSGVESTDAAGVAITSFELTAVPSADFSGRGYLLNKRLYVEQSSIVGNNEVLIGEEKITIASNGNDTTYGNYIEFSSVTARASSSSIKCYPHGIGALVARTNYTESSPETGSPLALYGLYIDPETVDGNITYGDLDAYATNLLLGYGNFYRKATCWAPIYTTGVKRVTTTGFELSTPPVLGDTVDIVPFSGDTPLPYEVVEVDLDYDGGKITLQLGDYEMSQFTSIIKKTNALDRTLT